MVVFSKHIHSESKIEKDLKDKYPKVESFPLTLTKKIEPFCPLSPRFPRIKQLQFENYGFASIYEDLLKRNKKNKKNQINCSKTTKSFDNIINIEKLKNNLRKIKLDINNNNDYHLNVNKSRINNIKNKNSALFRANVYYTKLHLQKLSKHLEKYTYLNEKK